MRCYNIIMNKDEIFAIFQNAEKSGEEYASSKPRNKVLSIAKDYSAELNILLQKANYNEVKKVASLSGWISGISKHIGLKKEEVCARRTFILFCKKSFSTKKNDEELDLFSEELEKLALLTRSEFYKNGNDVSIAQLSAVLFNDSATTILEKIDVDNAALDHANMNLTSAERMRELSGDTLGVSFDFMARSLYYRRFFMNRKDKSALKIAWKYIDKALKIFERKDVSEQSHDFTFALVDSCVKIIKLGEDYYKDIVKTKLLSKMDQRHQTRVDWQLLESIELSNIWDVVNSNYFVFGYEYIPEWATAESYRRELDNYIPDSNSVRDMLAKIRSISLNVGISEEKVDLIIRDEFSKLGNSTASWYGVDDTIDAIIGEIKICDDCLELSRIVEFAIIEYCSERWSTSDRFFEFVKALSSAVVYAENKLGSINLVDLIRKKLDDIGESVDCAARNMAIDFLSIDSKEAAIWVFSNLLNIDLYHLPSILDGVEYGTDSLILLHGRRGSGVVLTKREKFEYYINQHLDGRRLTAYNYSLTLDKDSAFITALQTAQYQRRYRKVWVNVINSISLELRDIGSWIVDNVPRSDNSILLVSALGYYAFFPTTLISVDGDSKRLVDFYTIINKSRLPYDGHRKEHRQQEWDSINILCCSEVPGFNALTGAKEECDRIKNLSWKECTELQDGSVSDVISLLEESAIFHFAGHGQQPNFTSPPALVTNSSTFGLEQIKELEYVHTPMAILSCCNASSNFSTSDVFGLDEYLIEKGVSICMSARWPVPDDDTKSFMDEFYQTYLDGLSQGRSGIFSAIYSYRKVQLDVKNKESKKFLKWSSFIMTI